MTKHKRTNGLNGRSIGTSLISLHPSIHPFAISANCWPQLVLSLLLLMWR